MLGALIFIFLVFCGVIAYAKREYNELQMFRKQQDYKGPGYGTYVTDSGRMDAITGEYCNINKPDMYGQVTITNNKGKVIRNVSEEMNKKIYEKSKELSHAYLTACKQELRVDRRKKNQVEGNRYLDLESGRIMVVRTFSIQKDVVNFFMDAKTGLLIRPTDWQRRIWDKKTPIDKRADIDKLKLETIKFVEEFNKKQEANHPRFGMRGCFRNYYNDRVSCDKFLDVAYEKLNPEFDVHGSLEF